MTLTCCGQKTFGVSTASSEYIIYHRRLALVPLVVHIICHSLALLSSCVSPRGRRHIGPTGRGACQRPVTESAGYQNHTTENGCMANMFGVYVYVCSCIVGQLL